MNQLNNSKSLYNSLFSRSEFDLAAVKIIEQFFDVIVSHVVEAMYRTNPCTMSSICKFTGRPEEQVAKSVATLLQHNLATFEEFSSNQLCYRLIKKNIFYLIRRNDYLKHVRSKLNVEAEFVLERLLEEGSATPSQIIVAICSKATTSDITNGGGAVPDRHVSVRDEFRRLVQRRYLKRCPTVAPASKPNCPALQHFDQELLYSFPSEVLDLQQIKKEIERRRLEADSGDRSSELLPPRHGFPDRDHVYTVDYDTFHLEWRNSLLTGMVRASLGPQVSEVFAALLRAAYSDVEDKWQANVNVTKAQVRDALPREPLLDHYLTLLESDSGGSVRYDSMGEGGGRYYLDVAALLDATTKEFLAKRVKEKFGSKAAKVFRLVLHNKVMSRDLVAAKSLLAEKEADQVSNLLLVDGYFSLHDLHRPSLPTAQAKDFKFYTINILEVVRMTTAQCFKKIYNILVKRDQMLEANKSLMGKKTRVEAIVDNLTRSGARPEQIEEVTEMMVPSERKAAQDWMQQHLVLLHVLSGVAEDIFLLELFACYHTTDNDVKA